MKTVKEVLGGIKGENKLNDVMTGKGAFSKVGFADHVNALVNDTTHTIPVYKDGQQTGTVCISELIRNDLKKTLAAAKYPQKSEIGVLDTTPISTQGLTDAFGHILMEYIKCGKKFDLPAQSNVNGSIYLAEVPGKVKTVQVRDPKTQQNLGTATITTKDSIQVRSKSPVPKHLQTKVRKDANGNIIK